MYASRVTLPSAYNSFQRYKNANVRVLHVEGPLTEPLREPYPEAIAPVMQDIPIDQARATFLVELQWPEQRVP